VEIRKTKTPETHTILWCHLGSFGKCCQFHVSLCVACHVLSYN